MAGIIEHTLGSAVAFVSRPAGLALTIAATAALTGGVVYAKNWWDGIEAKDGVIETLQTNLTTVTGDLRQAELDAADARIGFDRTIADLQHQVGVNAGEAAAQRIRAARLILQIEELRHEQTGPLAPVLVSALDRVRDDLRGFQPT